MYADVDPETIAADTGKDAVKVKTKRVAQQRNNRLGELEHSCAATRLEHTQHLSESALNVTKIAQTECNGYCVESAVAKGKLQCVCFGEGGRNESNCEK